MTTVSLITGCYNGEKFIDRCFRSILSQTYNDMEVIFVDDGSTDRSLQTAESYRAEFEKRNFPFRIISQQNKGFYPQSGIKVANGKYITTLDIDDLLLPESIRKRAEFLDSHPDHAAVRTNGAIIYEDEPDRPTGYFMTADYRSENVFEQLLHGKTTNMAGTYMVRADILFEYYPDRTVPMDRLTQNLQILMPVTHNRKVGYINEVLMNYMRHDQQTTSSKMDYQTAVIQNEAFKQVRLRILNQLNLLTPETQSKLDRTYDSVFLSLAYQYNEKEAFNSIYKSIKKPGLTEKLQDSKINNRRFSYFLLRVLNKSGFMK